MKLIKQFIQYSIESSRTALRDQNVETGLQPLFFISARQSNDGERLNLYFDYGTSRQWINRKIIGLGYLSDFSPDDIEEMERFTIEVLKNEGFDAFHWSDRFNKDLHDGKKAFQQFEATK